MILELPGKVSESTTRFLFLSTSTNATWFFVDYSSHCIPEGTRFSQLIDEENRTYAI